MGARAASSYAKPAESADQPPVRDGELARTDVLWDIAVKTAVEAPSPEAIDAATRVLQLRSRLLGLD